MHPWQSSATHRRLVPALKQAIQATFDRGDWQELAYETGTDDWILSHDRLLRSLRWGDEDYPSCVFDAVRHIIGQNPNNAGKCLQHPKIRVWMQEHEAELYSKCANDPAFVPTFRPATPTARQLVEQALDDAAALSASSGSVAALDRIHMALHAYLIEVCDRFGIPYSADPSITQLFKALRRNHPALAQPGVHAAEITKILNALASVVDALNPLRNRGTRAHPNRELLEEAEASLAINATRTLLHYLDAKLR